MTVVEKSHTNNNYHVALEINERYGKNYYTVQVCPMIGEHLCGYPVKEMMYAMSEKNKAINTYNRYVKKYV